jgi:hypothetical protein
MIDRLQSEALKDLSAVATHLNIPFMLIGAAARLVMFDWKHATLPQHRTTTDWDHRNGKTGGMKLSVQ